ncbi:DUF5949 family protein [Streptomyces sp. AK010]|uniref:DUF5949 family protein n=1 Tax=Streptomyces sp. AK010 TaxID=2723074 RepID=UPI001807661E|nr:DUF5949 family protein [Streptomyces sp. AK010]MBB6421548.1 hypothetical protein [Streptomyces sp. AK010]
MLVGAGLPLGEGLVHAAQQPSSPSAHRPIGPSAQSAGEPARRARSAVLTVQHLKSQFVPPETWLETVGELGFAHLILATRPWPEGAEPGDAEALAAFTSDEDAMASAAHVVLAARSPRS